MADASHPDKLHSAYEALSADEKSFADIINVVLANVAPAYEEMARTALSLLVLAASGEGAHISESAPDSEKEEYREAMAYKAGYLDGISEGRNRGIREMITAVRTILDDAESPQ